MNIGKAVMVLRKGCGFTQKELAEKCELSANAMCSIENGLSFPSRDTIEKICNALSIPVSYLLFFSISEEDVPEEKRVAFRILNEPLKAILMPNPQK